MLLYYFLTVLSWFFNLLPRAVALRIGDLFGLGWYWLIPIRRAHVVKSLTSVFGYQKSEWEINKLASQNFRHYGRCIVEILRSITWSKKRLQKEVTIHGLENARQFYKAGKGGFCLASHLGNWELLAASGAAYGMPVDVVVKRAKSKMFESFLKKYRKKSGMGLIVETGTAKDIMKALDQGRFIGFMMDQFMGPPVGIEVNFFGMPAGTLTSLSYFVEKKNVPVLPAYSFRDENGRLHTVIEPPLEYPAFSEELETRMYERTQFYNEVLERMIRRYPEQWLWLHRRWKPFRGEPRWQIKKAATTVTTLLLLFLAGCASTGETPTGIVLPPDPNIAVPKFEAQTAASETKPAEITPVVEAPAKKEKKVKKAVKETPTPTPAVTPKALFDIIPPDRVPFDIGERMEISLGWMALPAGTAVVEVRNGPMFNGRPTFHLWGNILSSKLVDTIYHVDNTIESFIDKEGFIPYKFLLHMLETHQKKETRVSFDHMQSKAFFWAKRVSQKWGDTFDDRADALVPQARDMFSALFYARTLNYELNKKQSFFIYENGQNWEVELLPIANEIVTTKVGAFQCNKISVTVRLNNILKPTGDIFMWLSDDSRRYLVKFEAKIKIGSLYGNLVSLKERL